MALLQMQRTQPKAGKVISGFHPILLLAPPVLLSMPLGLANNVSQPLALLLVAPIIAISLPRAVNSPGFLILIIGPILASIWHVASDPDREHSLFQAFRAFTPYLYINALLASYKDISRSLMAFIERHPMKWRSRIMWSIYTFCVFTTTQTISYFFGLPLANTLSGSVGERVMIFQTTSCVALFFFGITSGNFFVIGAMAFIILATGSKGVLIAAFLVAIVGIFSRFRALNFLKIVVAGILLATVAVTTQPLVFQRLADFVSGSSAANSESFGDRTRSYEIGQARNTLLESPINTLFGAGFSMQVSSGVRSSDPGWEENSKFDIENGYWGVLVKLGVIFSLVFIFNSAIKLPNTSFSLVILLVEFAIFFKTSYQIFCYFDGVMLLIWSIIISAMINMRRVGHKVISSIGLSGDNLARAPARDISESK